MIGCLNKQARPANPAPSPSISYQDYRTCYAHRVEAGPDFVPGLSHVAAHSRRSSIWANLDGVISTAEWDISAHSVFLRNVSKAQWAGARCASTGILG